MQRRETFFEQVPKAEIEKILAEQYGGDGYDSNPSDNESAPRARLPIGPNRTHPAGGMARWGPEFEKDQNDRFMTTKSWEKLVDISDDGILEILEQNAKWWDHAAVTCENTAARLAPGKKEEWLLLGAVYRERADKHTRLIEKLRQKGP